MGLFLNYVTLLLHFYPPPPPPPPWLFFCPAHLHQARYRQARLNPFSLSACALRNLWVSSPMAPLWPLQNVDSRSPDAERKDSDCHEPMSSKVAASNPVGREADDDAENCKHCDERRTGQNLLQIKISNFCKSGFKNQLDLELRLNFWNILWVV